MKMESKQVEVANADQGRLSELVTMPALAVLHRDLKVKAVIAEKLLAVLCDPSKTVRELLEGLSCVAHLLFILYRALRTATMTGQLYHDLQATICGIFYVVLKVQQDCRATPVFLWQIGTDALENLFAVVRTLIHGSNIDGKELGDRLGAAVALEEIYAKHPSWARKSRRLSLACLGEIDHMNVRTWREAGPGGSCDVRQVKVVGCWNEGRRNAIRVLQDHEEYTGVSQATFDDFKDKGITMFFPFGTNKEMPGVRAEDGTDACDEEERVVGQAASPSDGGGDSDNAELREVLDTEGEESSSSTHSPFVQVGAKKIFKASAVKEYTGPHAGKASRDRLARVRAFTTPAGARLAAGSTCLDDSGTALQIGSPFAALFRLRAGRHQPVSYCVGVLVVSAPPAAGGEAADGQVVKGQLMRMRLVGGDGDGSTFEWEDRKLHTATTYSCSLALVEELDPTLEMGKQTYVFSMDELITTQHVLQAEVERVQGWAAVPDVRPPPRNQVTPLPLHDNLTCMAGGALGAEEVKRSKKRRFSLVEGGGGASGSE